MLVSKFLCDSVFSDDESDDEESEIAKKTENNSDDAGIMAMPKKADEGGVMVMPKKADEGGVMVMPQKTVEEMYEYMVPIRKIGFFLPVLIAMNVMPMMVRNLYVQI